VIEGNHDVDCAQVSLRSTVAMYRGDTSSHERNMNKPVEIGEQRVAPGQETASDLAKRPKPGLRGPAYRISNGRQ